MLDGMPWQYRDYINEIPSGDETAIKTAIEKILKTCKNCDAEPAFFEYARNNLMGSKIAERIVELYKTCKGKE